jgi:hypothetical protein
MKVCILLCSLCTAMALEVFQTVTFPLANDAKNKVVLDGATVDFERELFSSAGQCHIIN